ncbi:MAG TPA: GNAT family N-acetyltransferase [Gaiellaceae bacterium]|nr:GNAT family N-acetyltransferase [Gaiellaceae bacterium]
MRSEQELVALAHASFCACFQKLAEHSPDGAIHESDGVFAFATGIRFSLFNGCIVTEQVATRKVDDALEWVEERGSPYRLWIVDELVAGFGDAPAQHGLELQPDPYPGMVLHPVPEAPPPAAGVEIEEAAPETARQVAVESGMPHAIAEQLYARSFADDPDVQLFAGRLEGRPVGTSVSIQGGGASGVVAVGTLPNARRRGVGTAVSWAAVDAGRRRGLDTVVLQASPMGLPVYEAMGFRTVVTYADFAATHPA